MDECALCDKVISEHFSLCDDCGEKTKEWDEETDCYIMNDGTVFCFNPQVFCYTQLENIYQLVGTELFRKLWGAGFDNQQQ